MASAAMVSVSTGVLKSVLAKLNTLMGDEYKKFMGLRKKVIFLQSELRDMDVLLEKMDNPDELDPQVKEWRKDIIDMSYDIEDNIDDFMQRVVGEADGNMGILEKVFNYLRTFKDRYHLANQFEEINARVMAASQRRQRYMLDQSSSTTDPVTVDPRLKAMYNDSGSLVGIDAQKVQLVNWAMDRGQQLKVMAIVGFGGLGKTTLANEVYREVGGSFDCKAFISVSQKPDMIGLFNSLLLQLGRQPYSHACQPQDPINKLREHLQNKRYLIVVDDLWDEKHWDQAIQFAFPQNNHCSRVMITTRNEGVSRVCVVNCGLVHTMKPLSEPDSRKLFFDRIFDEGEGACLPELRKGLSEILRKCGGLPLAIITMASMLACQLRISRLSAEQLESIQSSLSISSETNSNYKSMMYILDLSYKNLPHNLKACFLYLGYYPEDHEIDRVELVRRWVAEGIVSKSGGQDIWDAADSCFIELVNRSLIQPIFDKCNTMISSCRVHDMLLELIEMKCKEDNFLSLVHDPQAVVELQGKVIRRLRVAGLQVTEDDIGATTTAVNLARIRSLSTVGGESNWKPSLVKSRFVRVLSLHVSFKRHEAAVDLTVINQLPLLRYLKVSGDSVNIMLPHQIRGLRVLETLDFSDTAFLSIPLELVDVPRLSYLAMPMDEDCNWTRLPDWIGDMRSLCTLSGFELPLDSLEGIIGLGRLTALSSLQLSLAGPREHAEEATCMTALSSSLDKLCGLKQLRIGPSPTLIYAFWADDALSSISPPFRNLEVLDLGDGCTLSRVPRWIGCLHGLRELRLGAKQVLQEDVATMGTRLPSLVDLSLRIPGVPAERITVGGSTGFPALQCFSFDCDAMSYLMFEAGAMPALWELTLFFDEASKWDNCMPGGLQHLPSLEKIKTAPASPLTRRFFQEAADAHPKRPEVTESWFVRPTETEDYFGCVQMEVREEKVFWENVFCEVNE